MKTIVLLSVSLLLSLNGLAQQTGRLSVEVNAGLNGNFFVRSYDEVNVPQPSAQFLKKNFLGIIGGAEVWCRLSPISSIGVGYARSTNVAQANLEWPQELRTVLIKDFTIRHVNHFYQVCYEGQFTKRSSAWRYQLGGVYLHPQQQEIEVYTGAVLIKERKFRNSRLEELGAFVGLEYRRAIDTHFELGLRTRVYYLISTSTFEAVTLTPTLTYTFH